MIWDAIPYGYGPDVLLIRLRELRDVVDHHVIVEATSTFTGTPRDVAWLDLVTRPDFAEFADRVTVRIVDLPGRDGSQAEQAAWAREAVQRDELASALLDLGCDARDHVLFSDSDEIPHPEAIRHAVRTDHEEGQGGALWRLPVRYHEWWLDRVADGSPGHLWEFRQPLLMTWRHFRTRAPSRWRESQTYDLSAGPYGWHLTLQGGAADVVAKLQSYSHTELATMTEEHVQRLIDRDRDILNRASLLQVPFRELPRCVQTDPDRFLHLLSPEMRAIIGAMPEPGPGGR